MVSPPEDVAQCLVQLINSFVRMLVEPDLQGPFITRDAGCWSGVTGAQWALPSFVDATCKQASSPLAGSRDCPGPAGCVA